jgi:hypothetical protein
VGPSDPEVPVTALQQWVGLDRRRTAREPCDDFARYLIVEHADRGWGTCRVVDRSEGGAALLLSGPPWPRYRSEWRLLLEIADGTDEGERIACVRNTTVTEHGRVRLGVEFVD